MYSEHICCSSMILRVLPSDRDRHISPSGEFRHFPRAFVYAKLLQASDPGAQIVFGNISAETPAFKPFAAFRVFLKDLSASADAAAG